jgi:hypothetical protein
MRHPIYLDFAHDRRHRALLGATLLGAALALGVALVVWLAALDSALESAEQRNAAVQRRALAARNVAVVTLDAEEERKLASGLRQLTTPWEDLLGAAENAANPDVAVLSLQQEPAQNAFKLVAEARDTNAMLDYVQRLGEAKRIRSATLENHKVVVDQPGRPLRFAVTARYAGQP